MNIRTDFPFNPHCGHLHRDYHIFERINRQQLKSPHGEMRIKWVALDSPSIATSAEQEIEAIANPGRDAGQQNPGITMIGDQWGPLPKEPATAL